jgi:hypothetical protein
MSTTKQGTTDPSASVRKERGGLGDKTHVRAIVGNLEIFIPFYPTDPVRDHVAFSIAGLDIHCEAEVKDPDNRAPELPELLDIGGHPDPDFASDRSRQGDLACGYIDGPAGKQPGVAACVRAVPERVAAGKADIDAFVVPAIDNFFFRAIDDEEIKRLDKTRHDQSFRQH